MVNYFSDIFQTTNSNIMKYTGNRKYLYTKYFVIKDQGRTQDFKLEGPEISQKKKKKFKYASI